MTPLELEILLHCYSKRSPITNSEYPAQIEAIDSFLKIGLIEKSLGASRDQNTPIYCATEKGNAYVETILNMPLSPKKVQSKPPLGIIPKRLHMEQRVADLEAAMLRHNDAGIEVPGKWRQERYEINWLLNKMGQGK